MNTKEAIEFLENQIDRYCFTKERWGKYINEGYEKKGTKSFKEIEQKYFPIEASQDYKEGKE